MGVLFCRPRGGDTPGAQNRLSCRVFPFGRYERGLRFGELVSPMWQADDVGGFAMLTRRVHQPSPRAQSVFFPLCGN